MFVREFKAKGKTTQYEANLIASKSLASFSNTPGGSSRFKIVIKLFSLSD